MGRDKNTIHAIHLQNMDETIKKTKQALAPFEQKRVSSDGLTGAERDAWNKLSVKLEKEQKLFRELKKSFEDGLGKRYIERVRDGQMTIYEALQNMPDNIDGFDKKAMERKIVTAAEQA